MTSSGTVSQSVASGGHAQYVPNPTNWGSRTKANIVSAVYALTIPTVFGTTAYTAYLPQAAILMGVDIRNSTQFTSGATLSVGSAVAGVDILAATAASANSKNIPLILTPTSAVQNKAGQPEGVQEVFVTLAGTAATAGAGFVVITYINTLTAPTQP